MFALAWDRPLERLFELGRVEAVERSINISRLSLVVAAFALVIQVQSIPPALGEAVEWALLVDGPPEKALSPESEAARELLMRFNFRPTLIYLAGPGRFVDRQGSLADLTRVTVLWYHQGERSELPADMANPATLEALKAFLAARKGLFLSGAALQLVHSLGAEPITPRLGNKGQDNYRAAIFPEVGDHPIFKGLEPELDGRIFLASSGYPAFADFYHTGGPKGGMVLARACNADENPLVEYDWGGGRIIAMGWRAPFYSDVSNAYRNNLAKLTGNILAYLGNPEQWQKINVTLANAARPRLPEVSELENLRLAICDLIDTYGPRYVRGTEFLRRLDELRERIVMLGKEGPIEKTAQIAKAFEQEFQALKRSALLESPLFDFQELLAIERRETNLALPANWESHSSLSPTGYDNRLVVVSLVHPDGELKTVFDPGDGRYVGDVDLHFEGKRCLLTMPGSFKRFQVFELNLETQKLRELPLIREPDVDNYDACYLPDESIIFTSTAPFVGVPCVYGSSHVTNMYRLLPDGTIRQLTVDQEHNWHPVVAHDGRVVYLRWEYTDLPHAHSRILFAANPDGSNQMALYGTNSYFPNAFFYPQPIPGNATQFVGIISGHHGTRRSGRLVIIDVAQGRREAEGVVREIPGRGKQVEALIRDNLVDGVWPQFLHPYPLSDKYFLVSCKPAPDRPWGIYLVDGFDNIVLIKEKPGYALFEPIPLKPRRRPPLIPDRVEPHQKMATVYLQDVYAGPGLRGIPKGTVKKLRLFTYEFSYRGMGGLLGSIGMDGPWDVKKVLGTVPVESDGSALFYVPAYTPISVQPLDEQGQALQLMRSWFTAMPGEKVSCVGCHEPTNTAPPPRMTLALRRPPSEIEPWYGPPRGFSFAREVQPVLDRYCGGCHRPGQPGGPDVPEGVGAFSENVDLRGDVMITDWRSDISGHVSPEVGGKFSVAYASLHRFVRRPGIESDLHLLAPMEFHAATTELVQLLRKGHYDVSLDREAWDRMITWIDLNAPYHGSWAEIVGAERVRPLAERAYSLRRRLTGMEDLPPSLAVLLSENSHLRTPSPVVSYPDSKGGTVTPGKKFGVAFEKTTDRLSDTRKAVSRHTVGKSPSPVEATPFQRTRAVSQTSGESAQEHRPGPGGLQIAALTLGPGVDLKFVRIPAGSFAMGSETGDEDEKPVTLITIAKPFWISQFEITNAQYRVFAPGHDSGVESLHGYQFGIRGIPVNKPDQPVVRVSWNDAQAFCRWLSERTGLPINLPTEAQWEYACRAGTQGPFWFGEYAQDFSRFANMADAKLREFVVDTYISFRVIQNPGPYDDWIPKDVRFNDGGLVSVSVGSYAPNPWGLYDMHGNVAEWTRSLYRPYPYREDDGRNEIAAVGPRVVRGGSWYDRPKRCRSTFRLAYDQFAPVFNVGFRVVIEADDLSNSGS